MYAVREFTDRVPRDADAILCECGEVAEQVECTPEEVKKYGCGRFIECCARAFQCACGRRYAMSAEAPDDD